MINVKLFITQAMKQLFILKNFFMTSKIFGKEIGGNHGKDYSRNEGRN
jgi:hypothetical protein